MRLERRTLRKAGMSERKVARAGCGSYWGAGVLWLGAVERTWRASLYSWEIRLAPLSKPGYLVAPPQSRLRRTRACPKDRLMPPARPTINAPGHADILNPRGHPTFKVPARVAFPYMH